MSIKIERVYHNGHRYYKIVDNSKLVGIYPSVTTVLGNTSDQSGLIAWREKIGEEAAEKISKMSRERGTALHRLIELYKKTEGEKKDRLLELQQIVMSDPEMVKIEEEYTKEGWKMFYKFYLNSSRFFDRVKRVLEAETFLWSTRGGGYAGTVDNISELEDGRILIIDYKNSRKPKKREWIEDYFIQASAYFVAYWERTGVAPHGAEIWIVNELEEIPQIFEISKDEIKHYFKIFSSRVEEFYKTNPSLNI